MQWRMLYYICMAITKSAKKEIRASARKRVFNLRRLRTMRSLIKETIEKGRSGDSVGARDMYRKSQQAIDKASKRGIIKPRNASRKKSVLASAIKTSA